ncbi:unnamed protein product [Hyaloperonospora brassicae]|uniref:Uncharacterized protein n=1 Tax=Hyaloperonospora brassicae TaxID=162125 RepID=A0AAV0U7I3_HYABA|nr:unnamed protein product [Hyaloperonospora brassicae]
MLRLVLFGAALLDLPHTSSTPSRVASSPRTVRCFPSHFRFSATIDDPFPNVNRSRLQTANAIDSSRLLEPLPRPNVSTATASRKYRRDVQQVTDSKLSSVHVALSWAHVMHYNAATQRMEHNAAGLALYSAQLDALLAQGLEPLVTLFDSRLPAAALERPTSRAANGSAESMLCWLDPFIVTHFGDFAEVVFRAFGQKVKFWATFNEPLTFITRDYGDAGAVDGTSALEAKAVHHVLLAHAKAVALFRELQRSDASAATAGAAAGGGSVVAAAARIGMMVHVEVRDSVHDDASSALDVAERTIPWTVDWFVTPLLTGDYSERMHKRRGAQLPQFSAAEAALVKGSYDLWMLNWFAMQQGRGIDRGGRNETRASSAACVSLTKSSKCSGREAHVADYFHTIKWLHEKDPSMEILLTENKWRASGQADATDELPLFRALVERVYKAVVEEEMPIIGFPAWTFPDINDWDSCNQSYIMSSSTNGSHRVGCPAAKWLVHLLTTKCLDGWEHEVAEMDVNGDKGASSGTQPDLEIHGMDGAVPWSLGEVAVLIVIGIFVLAAITCEVMRELQMSSRGRSEELQVLITVEG